MKIYIEEGPSREYPAVLVMDGEERKACLIGRPDLDRLIHDGQVCMMETSSIHPETEFEEAYWEDAKSLGDECLF